MTTLIPGNRDLAFLKEVGEVDCIINVEHMKLSDEQIVGEIVLGNKTLFASIVDRYQEKLLRYATYLVHDTDEAQDVVQDSFISAYKNLNGFRRDKKFSSWIYRIVHNMSMNSMRNRWRFLPMLPDFDWPSGQDLEEEMMYKEKIKMVSDCLDNLKLKYSEPLALYYLEEKTYREISDILRIPEGTVAIRISRAKKLMKQICKKQ